MLGITRNGSEYTAKCGRARCALPIIETVDPESGRTVVEAVSGSGIRGLFRTAVDVKYVPVNTKDETGQVTTTFVPRSRIYDRLEDCIRRGKHVLLTGPTATGKTLAVEEVCIRLGAPLVVIRGCEGLEDRDMIGATILTAETAQDGSIASSTRFVPGPPAARRWLWAELSTTSI